MTNEKQNRHEKLIALLNKYSQYQSPTGTPNLKVVKSPRSSNHLADISINEINHAVVAFTDVLNISGGSIGNVDLYKLLQVYLTNQERRVAINQLISGS